ncbi:MAG: phospholipid-binding protein MlaC [Hyphomonadaceae bacterium]
MTSPTMSRAAFLASLAGAALFAAAPDAHAARNEAAEQYVQRNAAAALATLGDRSLSATQRQQTFTRLMAEFSDMPRIAVWVLGRYSAQLRSDTTLRTEWTRAFQDYAIATYETRLASLSGGAIRVTGSDEVVAGRTVDVRSEITPPGERRGREVIWRLNRAGDAWKVWDINVRVDNGDRIWLGQHQQLEFLGVLNQNQGDIRALMGSVRTMTASMRQRIVART